ncbi:MAG: HAD-IA family hydrolase [Lachnospiraceae bacterium]|nr:HAD-IA family hydrolase [Lachnospiraceae bacterium]
MSTKAVIFDLDDTLASETDYARSGYRAVSSYLIKTGFPVKDGDLIYREFISLFNEDHKRVFNRFLINHGLPDSRDRVMELVEVYRNHLPDIAYYEDVEPLLLKLGEMGIKKGILSDGYAVTQRQKIKALKAEEDFDIIVLTDELGREAWKPSPKGFELIEERLSLKPAEILYVGDNPEKDFYLSVTAGIRTARIIREEGVYSSREYYEGVKEDMRITSLEEIAGMIGD